MNKFKLIESEERRGLSDRRVEFAPTSFPVFTKQGTWIRKECRKTPERRVDNINVSESLVDDEEFKEIFKEYT